MSSFLSTIGKTSSAKQDKYKDRVHLKALSQKIQLTYFFLVTNSCLEASAPKME